MVQCLKAVSTGVVCAAVTLTSQLSFGQAEADDLLQTGTGKFRFAAAKYSARRAVRVWHYRPATFTTRSRIIFTMHGAARNGRGSRDAWLDFADKTGALIIAPEFDDDRFPGSAYYEGNVRNQRGRRLPNSQRTFSVVDQLFDHVKKESGSIRSGYTIFGHSAGAQFVHRMILLDQSSRIELAIAANAGWYTLPTLRAPFPYGLGGWSISQKQVRAAFTSPLVVLLGEHDTGNDRYLRRTMYANLQGLHRFARGRSFFAVAERTAADYLLDFHWQLRTVPMTGHEGPKMARAAQSLLSDLDSTVALLKENRGRTATSIPTIASSNKPTQLQRSNRPQ
jgi:poly(3-hydroxybutyrate) depolymerase